MIVNFMFKLLWRSYIYLKLSHTDFMLKLELRKLRSINQLPFLITVTMSCDRNKFAKSSMSNYTNSGRELMTKDCLVKR